MCFFGFDNFFTFSFIFLRQNWIFNIFHLIVFFCFEDIQFFPNEKTSFINKRVFYKARFQLLIPFSFKYLPYCYWHPYQPFKIQFFRFFFPKIKLLNFRTFFENCIKLRVTKLNIFLHR
jgi:hypothetical protein